MSRYIDADIAKKKLKEYCVDDDSTVQYWYDLMGIDDCIDKTIPTADVRENVKGTWKIYCDEKGVVEDCYCDQCGSNSVIGGNFCPNCGADMRGEA